MKNGITGRMRPGTKKGLREIGPSAAALGPAEYGPESVSSNDSEGAGADQTAAGETPAILPAEVATVPDKFIRDIHTAVQNFNTEMMSEDTRRGKEALARRGVMPGGVGSGIYGYDYSPELRRRVVNEDEAVVVLWIFCEFADGRTRYSIFSQLNADGVPSKKGGKWGCAVLKNMLANESYLGVDYYGKTRTVRGPDGIPKKVWVPRREWIEIREFTPPLVPPLVFYRVKERLRSEQGREGKSGL